MNKMNWIIAILVGIAVVCTLITYARSLPVKPNTVTSTTTTSTVSPAHPIKPTAPVPPASGGILIHSYGDVTLSLGQTAKFTDVTIVPVSVVQDSRCPLGVLCMNGFQAGTVQVSVRITTSSGSLTQTLTLSKPFTIGKDALTLSGVQPVKRRDTTIAPSDYQLTFTVQPAS